MIQENERVSLSAFCDRKMGSRAGVRFPPKSSRIEPLNLKVPAIGFARRATAYRDASHRYPFSPGERVRVRAVVTTDYE
jgi:hypothetical protein